MTYVISGLFLRIVVVKGIFRFGLGQEGQG